MVGWAWPDAAPADAFVRTAVVAVALIVAPVMALGAAGRLTIVAILFTQALAFAAILALAQRTPRARPTVPEWPLPAIGIVAATVAFALAFGATHAPLTLYDSLSYHLFFAATWVQSHGISIVPTPFSDVAQAYAPANGELLFAWLMLPFHSDVVARVGQLPFGILAAAALYAMARRLGAPPTHAFYPSAFLLLSRPIVEQMVGANVDLICAALFLASMYLVVRAVDTNRAADWAVAGASAGLYGGTKYLALVYAPALLLVVVARGLRTRALWLAPGIAAFALPWYARNWIVAGSPIYPASVTIAGVTIARGAFSRAAMLNTIFHTTDLRLLPAIAAHAFGPALFVVWLPCAAIGMVVMVRRGWWPHGAIALATAMMPGLYWFGLPVNTDSRFLMPAIAPALLPLAFLFPRARRAELAVHVAYTIALLWLVVGARASLPAAVPWFMRGWLALDGLVTAPFLVAFALTATASALTWHVMRRMPRTAAWVAAAACAAAALVVAAGADRDCPFPRCDVLHVTPPFIRSHYLDSWDWIDGNVSNALIAYTGINLPYPLTGRDLTNRVVYVNIDGRARWRFHDYDRAYRAGRFDPPPPLLATSSGELMPVVARAGRREDALRPRYERMQGIREAWQFNLETMRVQYLFVSTLSAYEIDYVWHDGAGFPIEDTWARSDPVRFHLVYANAMVHVYAVDLAKKARA